MNTRKVAIACQGGGIRGAFTCGVLTALLKAKEQETWIRGFCGALPDVVESFRRRSRARGLLANF
jgi:predicted patatin/cPLA2 family phospholipase